MAGLGCRVPVYGGFLLEGYPRRMRKSLAEFGTGRRKPLPAYLRTIMIESFDGLVKRTVFCVECRSGPFSHLLKIRRWRHVVVGGDEFVVGAVVCSAGSTSEQSHVYAKESLTSQPASR